MAGNTLLRPPRLTGDPQKDALTVQRWMQDMFLFLVDTLDLANTLADHETRIAALEARVTALEEGP